METLQSKKDLKAIVAEHPVADMTSRMMPPTLTWTSASEKQLVGLYRTQGLAMSLLPYTCHDRGAGTRGRNAPLGREGLLQTKSQKEKE